MEPTAHLVADYLEHLAPHPGLAAETTPLFYGPNHTRLTRSGVAKLLTRHVQAVRAHGPAGLQGFRSRPTPCGAAGRCT